MNGDLSANSPENGWTRYHGTNGRESVIDIGAGGGETPGSVGKNGEKGNPDTRTARCERRRVHPGRPASLPARVSPRESSPRSLAGWPVDRLESSEPRCTRNDQARFILKYLDDRTGATCARVGTGRLPISLRDRQAAGRSGNARTLKMRVETVISMPRTGARVASRYEHREYSQCTRFGRLIPASELPRRESNRPPPQVPTSPNLQIPRCRRAGPFCDNHTQSRQGLLNTEPNIRTLHHCTRIAFSFRTQTSTRSVKPSLGVAKFS